MCFLLTSRFTSLFQIKKRVSVGFDVHLLWRVHFVIKCTRNMTKYVSHSMTKPAKWCAPSEDSDQPGHPPSLIRVFAVCMKKPWVIGYLQSAKWRLGSDYVDAQADPSLRWAHRSFCWFCCVVAHLKIWKLLFDVMIRISYGIKCLFV